MIAHSLIPFLILARPQGDGMVAMHASEVKPLAVGTKAPDAEITSRKGKAITLLHALKGQPTVLIFYRGSWCPFCNAHLADLETVQPELKKPGYRTVAITPDLPSEIEKTVGKNKLDFKIYSDSKANALKAFGVAFKLEDETYGMMKDKYGVDLEKSSGETHHILPVPSVFLIDKDGTIQYVHSNPDYKVRLKGSEVVEAAKNASHM